MGLIGDNCYGLFGRSTAEAKGRITQGSCWPRAGLACPQLLLIARARVIGAEVMSANPFRLDGKPAIVVGAALGIGRAIALAFADAGAKVACLDIDEAAASETAARINSAR